MPYVLVLVFAFAVSLPSHAQPRATPKQCNQWAKQIDKYNDKRRKGGKLSQMERYRDKVDHYQKLRYEGRCRARYNHR